MTQRFTTAAEILKEAAHDFLEGQQDSVEAMQAANDALSKMSFNKVEAYTDILERLNEIDEVRRSKQDAITAAMEKQHSLAQSLREETANITAELDANKHTEAWLDEDARKLIFNDEDFEAEQKAINDIQAEATAVYEKYRKQVSELDETEWFKEQQLTDEYNKRMDILSEQLETEKQRIALKKKELEYDNALKERDTRIILGGRAVQVANPDTMYNLAKERSLAESDLVNTLTTNRETEQERQSDRISQSIAQEISMREKITALIGNMTDAEKELFAATLPVIEELDTFKAMLSPENIPWLNEHSRDYRGQFVDMDELYKHAGYNMSFNYAGAYDVVDKLHSAGILTDNQYKAMTGQLENQHNWKRATDINTSMYSYTNRYGAVRYDTESYGINDEAALADSEARDTAREYSRLITELNSGRGTQETLNRLKELNDTTATDNKYILNLLDTTQYAVNEDGVVIRRDSIDQIAEGVGEIAHGVIRTIDMQNGDIARGNLSYVPDGEIARGNFANAYASGTTSAKRGLALTDEEGLEMKLRKFGGQYRMLEGGERIFTAEQTDKLLAFSRAPENFMRDSLLNNMQKSNSQAISNVIANDNRSEVHNHYDFGGVVVEHPVDADDLVSSLVRQANSRWDVTKNMKRQH